MRYICFFYFLLAFNVLSAQDYDLPDMGTYDLGTYYWEDMITANQIKKGANGEISLEYVDLNDSMKLRKEYFRDGKLKLIVEVFQAFCSDIFVSFDPVTYEEEFEIVEGICDIFHGIYIEYQHDFQERRLIDPLTKGYYKNGKKYGEWRKISESEGLSIANYNAAGKLEGTYTAYYFDLGSIKKQVKLQGEYKVYKMKQWYRDGGTGEYKSNEHHSARRVGEWRWYNKLGELIETVKYEHHEK
ncbi:MAG: antitoxin component YwqK of YwqJK toxin-antitoxin module [Maribacter sp.]|jgi:antitoxin component YwqK of YwqJK toxin-antitoxin module